MKIVKRPVVVDHVPLYSYRKPRGHDEWQLFGGGVSFDESMFETCEDALRFFNDILALLVGRCQRNAPNLWVE